MSKTHCLSGTRLHRIWKNMRTRCNNPNRKGYKNYGGRGIKVCDEWNDFVEFHEWAISNGYKDGLTIERKDVNKGYSPDNCTWITAVDQAKNRTTSVKVFYKGSSITPTELSRMTGWNIWTIYNAIRGRKIKDFTNWKPQNGVAPCITQRKDRFEVTVKQHYIGRFGDIESAIIARDEAIKRYA